MNKKETFNLVCRFLTLLGIAGVFSLLVFAGWKFKYAPEPAKLTAEDYRAYLQEHQATAQAREEWHRLYKKHGYPGAVIYPDNDTPYYMCGPDKKEKCKFK